MWGFWIVGMLDAGDVGCGVGEGRKDLDKWMVGGVESVGRGKVTYARLNALPFISLPPLSLSFSRVVFHCLSL